ncbi:MAG: hypothetical protein E6Q24_21255 [Chitinophagaceae bacterium]|nr:MAG: hypothetical protein E6Q24_21255 [Chitinophagaceae bacterium]
MNNRYIKERKTRSQNILSFFKGIIIHWPTSLSVLTFFSLACIIKSRVPDAILSQVNNTAISAASILTAVLITFLVARVIQIRQERIAVWNEYHVLTQRMHHFRGAVYPLFTSYNFWPNDLKYDMEHTYKDLTYYDVKKSIFVHGTDLSDLAQKFVNEEGGAKSLYLQLRTFFKGDVPHDISMFKGEFDSHLYYNTDELERWIMFDCGNGLYYYFNHKYTVYQNDFHFNNISSRDQQSVIDHCMRIDPERYRNMAFGHSLYDSLGQQFSSQLLPDLYKLSRIVNGKLPHSVSLLAILLTLLIPFGIIIPFFISLGLLPVGFAVVSLSGILSLLVFIMLTFYKMLSKEIKIDQNE